MSKRGVFGNIHQLRFFSVRSTHVGTTNHKRDLPSDLLNLQTSVRVEPENSPVHCAKEREPERLTVTPLRQGQIVDEPGKDLFVLVPLANQFFDSRKRVVSRRRKDCAGYAAAKQYITMRNDRFFEPLPRLRDIRNSSFHLSPHCREALLVDGEEKILLRWKVIVERSGQNAGRGRNVTYRSALKSFARKQLRCSGDNLLSTVRSLSRLFGFLSTTFDCDSSRHCSSFNNRGCVLELDNSDCFSKSPKPGKRKFRRYRSMNSERGYRMSLGSASWPTTCSRDGSCAKNRTGPVA